MQHCMQPIESRLLELQAASQLTAIQRKIHMKEASHQNGVGFATAGHTVGEDSAVISIQGRGHDVST